MLDADSIALDLLRRARLDVGDPVPMPVLAHNLRVTLVPAAPRGCAGATVLGIVFYDGTIRALAHELAHVACTLAGLPVPHDERLVAAVGARLVTPAQAVRRALRAGLQRAQLAEAFGVSHTCAALRRGEITHEPVAIVTPATVYVRGDWEWPAEDVLRRMVRQRWRTIRSARLGDDPRRQIVVPR